MSYDFANLQHVAFRVTATFMNCSGDINNGVGVDLAAYTESKIAARDSNITIINNPPNLIFLLRRVDNLTMRFCYNRTY